MDFLAVALLGALVGAGELVSRYRDDPLRALRSLSAVLYVTFNIIAALAALALVEVFHWNFGIHGSHELRWSRVLLSGFGAMAVFRTSLFVLRVGDKDVGIGPASLLQVAMDASDRGVDRYRGTHRATEVGQIMEKVDFEKAFDALPAFCMALMQNPAPTDQESIANQVARLINSTMDSKAKTLNLGLVLMNVVGRDVLEAAVQGLGATIAI